FVGAVEQQMRNSLAFQLDTVFCQACADLSASERTFASKQVADEFTSAFADCIIKTEFGTAALVTRDKSWSEERQQPIEIVTGQQVDCAALCPNSYYGAI